MKWLILILMIEIMGGVATGAEKSNYSDSQGFMPNTNFSATALQPPTYGDIDRNAVMLDRACQQKGLSQRECHRLFEDFAKRYDIKIHLCDHCGKMICLPTKNCNAGVTEGFCLKHAEEVFEAVKRELPPASRRKHIEDDRKMREVEA